MLRVEVLKAEVAGVDFNAVRAKLRDTDAIFRLLIYGKNGPWRRWTEGSINMKGLRRASIVSSG